jgi:hypothetical protein
MQITVIIKINTNGKIAIANTGIITITNPAINLQTDPRVTSFFLLLTSVLSPFSVALAVVSWITAIENKHNDTEPQINHSPVGDNAVS